MTRLLAEAEASISTSDVTMTIERAFTAAPYLVVGVLALIATWRFVLREWLDRREESKSADRAAETAELSLKLKIAEAHRDTSRSLEVSSGTLRDLTVKQEALITKLAEHAEARVGS